MVALVFLVDTLPAAAIDAVGGPDALHELCLWVAEHALTLACGVALLVTTQRVVTAQLARQKASTAAGTPAADVQPVRKHVVSLGSTHPSLLVPLCAFFGGIGCVLLLVASLRDNRSWQASMLQHGMV